MKGMVFMKVTCKEELLKAIAEYPTESNCPWQQGVKFYAEWLVDNIDDYSVPITEKTLLNGAKTWKQYSWGGCAFIYNGDICEKLATPDEQRRKKNGLLPPNPDEEWLDTQARALFQASRIILDIVNNRV